MPRVWILSETYYPEEVSTSFYVTGVAEALAQRFEVHAITSQPTYARRGERHPRREVHNGVHIERCINTTLDKNRLPTRIANAVTVTGSMMATSLARFARGDVVITWTNPPFLPWLVLGACRAKGARCLIRVDDVYPEAAIAAGVLNAGSPMVHGMNAIGNFTYSHVDGIIVMGRCMAELLRGKVGSSIAPTTLIPSWTDTQDIVPWTAPVHPIREELGLTDKFVVLIAGNLGRVQGLEIVIEAAQRLRDTRAHFLLFGTGAKEAWLRQQIQDHALANVTLAGRRPPSEKNTFQTAGDVALISLSKGMFGAGVPSRLYNFMAAGVPVIAATGRGSETSLVVEEEQIGWSVEPEDGQGLAQIIREAAAAPGQLREMAQRARAAAEAKYSYAQVVRRYIDLVEPMFAANG